MKNPLLPFLLVCSLACSKNSRSGNDHEAPLILLTSPSENQRFAGGAAVQISGQLSDDQKLAEVHVHISNIQTGALLIDIHRYPAAATYTLAESFQVNAGINYKIQVIAKDNSANEARAAVEISTN